MTNPGKEVRVAIILNGLSSYSKIFYRKFYEPLSQAFTIAVFKTCEPYHGFSLAKEAVSKGYDFVFAAGGDGTLHEVVNGVIAAGTGVSEIPKVGLIPIGSGNDFARTMKLKADSQHIISLIKNSSGRLVNIGKITFTTTDGETDERYFINVADIAMGPEVVKRVASARKRFGSAIAYYKSIVETFLSFQPMTVTATTPEWTWTGKLRSLAVANGKYYGHGLCIAPGAQPDDDMFEFFICGNVSAFDFIRYSGTLKRNKYLRVKNVEYRAGREVHFTSMKPCLIEGDGELLGILPATVSLTDIRLNFVS